MSPQSQLIKRKRRKISSVHRSLLCDELTLEQQNDAVRALNELICELDEMYAEMSDFERCIEESRLKSEEEQQAERKLIDELLRQHRAQLKRAQRARLGY